MVPRSRQGLLGIDDGRTRTVVRSGGRFRPDTRGGHCRRHTSHRRCSNPCAMSGAESSDPAAACDQCGGTDSSVSWVFVPYGSSWIERHTRVVDDSTAVEQFRALGDPIRWAIVTELQGGTRCACRLAEVAEVSPPLLSHHLKVLREAGLITGERRGRWIDYTLDADTMNGLAGGLDRRRVGVG